VLILCLAVQDQPLFSDRSRLPGFKSSLNHVHLKIYHDLNKPAYPTDGVTLAIPQSFASHFYGIWDMERWSLFEFHYLASARQ
jgi:hypothetical protein